MTRKGIGQTLCSFEHVSCLLILSLDDFFSHTDTSQQRDMENDAWETSINICGKLFKHNQVNGRLIPILTQQLPVRRKKATPDMKQDSTKATMSVKSSCLEALGLLHVNRLTIYIQQHHTINIHTLSLIPGRGRGSHCPNPLQVAHDIWRSSHIGGTQKIWGVPGYAHAPFCLK